MTKSPKSPKYLEGLAEGERLGYEKGVKLYEQALRLFEAEVEVAKDRFRVEASQRNSHIRALKVENRGFKKEIAQLRSLQILRGELRKFRKLISNI